MIEQMKPLRTPEELAERKASRQAWLKIAEKCFLDAGFVEFSFLEIPNEYCSQDCCTNRVWVRAATNLGIIKLGPRKSVWALDWSQSFLQGSADNLFPNEEVTKIDRSIHCWGPEKVTQYLKSLRAFFVTECPVCFESPCLPLDPGNVCPICGTELTTLSGRPI